jgi:hypothetical protein
MRDDLMTLDAQQTGEGGKISVVPLVATAARIEPLAEWTRSSRARTICVLVDACAVLVNVRAEN